MRLHPPLLGLLLLIVTQTPALLAAPQTPTTLLTLDGAPATPFGDIHSRAFVFLFVSTGCPIANAYAPEIRRLETKFAPFQVSFHLVYPDPSDAPSAIRKHLQEFNLPKNAFRDPTHAFVRFTGATVIPEAVVYSSTRELVYQGRINNRHVGFGEARPQATQHDLADAISAVLQGTLPPAVRTQAVGCYIGDLK